MPIAVASVFSLLLVATGIAKLIHPTDTARAIALLGIPGARWATFALALTEISVGAITVTTAAPLALGVQAGLYAGFLAWVTVAMVRGLPIASCGCVGRPDTPPYWGHVILNGIAVACSLGAIPVGGVSPVGALEWATQLIVVVAGAAMAWSILGIGATGAGRIRV